MTRIPWPEELLDPDGEGIYLLNEDVPGSLLRAAAILGCHWREIQHRTVYMRPNETGDEWHEVDIGRYPRGWKLNLPRRWRPVAYAYFTPPTEPLVAS